MLNGFFVLCCLCQNALRVHHFCNSMNTVATWFMLFPKGHWWKKASLILQFRPESNAEKSGSHQFTSSAGFSNPHPRQNKKKLANKTIYEDVFRFKTSTLPYKLFRSNHLGQFFRFLKKHSRIKTTKHKTMAFTHQKSTQKSKQNKQKSKSKQNKFPNKTTQNKTKLRLQANKIQNTKNNKHTKKIQSNKIPNTKKNKQQNHKPFSLWVHISEFPGNSPPWWLCIAKAHCLSCNFRCLQSINLWTTRETRCPKTKASVTKTENNGRKENSVGIAEADSFPKEPTRKKQQPRNKQKTPIQKNQPQGKPSKLCHLRMVVSKKSPTGPTERRPKPEYLFLARSQLTKVGSVGIRSHSIFDGLQQRFGWTWYGLKVDCYHFHARLNPIPNGIHTHCSSNPLLYLSIGESAGGSIRYQVGSVFVQRGSIILFTYIPHTMFGHRWIQWSAEYWSLLDGTTYSALKASVLWILRCFWRSTIAVNQFWMFLLFEHSGRLRWGENAICGCVSYHLGCA